MTDETEYLMKDPANASRLLESIQQVKDNNVFVRLCGRCSRILSPENTGLLEYLQPNCNECTEKDKS